MRFKAKWKYSLQGARSVTQRSPVVTGNIALVTFNHGAGATMRGTLCALDIETGDLLWQFATDHFLNEPVVSPEGVIFITCFDGSAYKLGLDGSQLWKAQPAQGNVWAGTICGDKLCYAEIGGGSKYTWALNIADGSLAWQYENGGHAYALDTSSGGRLVHASVTTHRIGEYTHYLHCIDAATGRSLWKVTHDSRLFSPLIIGNHIYVGSRGHVYVFDLDSGNLLAKYAIDSDSAVFAKPIKTERGVIFLTDAGCLFCMSTLDENAGGGFELLWSETFSSEIRANIRAHEGNLYAILESAEWVKINPENGTIEETRKLSGFKAGYGLAPYQGDWVVSVSPQCARLA